MTLNIHPLAIRTTCSDKSFPISAKKDILGIQDPKHAPISLKKSLDPVQKRWERMDNIALAHIWQFHHKGADLSVYLWEEKENRNFALRYIGSGFYLLKLQSKGITKFDAIIREKMGGRVQFLDQVSKYLQTITSYEGLGSNQDYDMDLTHLATILFAFVDDANLLTKDMVWSIICQKGQGGCSCDDGNPTNNAVATWSGQGLNRVFEVEVVPVHTAETENHVLMIHSWKYLINQYVYWVGNFLARKNRSHPRFDRRIEKLYNQNPGYYKNEGGKLENLLFQALGRILHNGMFEENARAYESLSMHAILNLYMGANALHQTDSGQRLKMAAQNAMEFLIAKFTFQSFECKRIAPMRRNWDYRRRYGIGNNDYMIDMIGMMSGAYAFNDKINTANNENPISRYDFRSMGRGGSYALWAALMMSRTNYVLPDSLYDFLHHKHQGYWTRINTIYTTDHYPLRTHWQIYFDDTGEGYSRHTNGTFSSSPELYFCTPDFLNSSGGYGVKYFPNPIQYNERGKVYNFLSVPYTVIPKGDIGRDWGNDGDDFEKMHHEILVMSGNENYPFESKNIWTYKNFSYGYTHDDENNDNQHRNWPQKYPPEWNSFPESKKAILQIGRAHFKIFDLKNLHGFYVILAQVSKQKKEGQLREYGRGFWEIVPGYMFGSVAALTQRVKDFNPESHFPNLTDDNGTHHYWYKLAVSGDTLKLDDKVGAKGSDKSIMEIKDHTGREIDLTEVHTNLQHPEILKNMPLIDVSEVDQNFRFTGIKYATAPGNGRLEVYNPFVGERLILDSRDIMNPRREIQSVTR